LNRVSFSILKIRRQVLCDMREATAQQKLFVDEYLKFRKSNQKEAAIRAGYSPKSAESQASQLLKNTQVQKYLNEREKQVEADLRQEFMFDALEARKVMYEIMNSKGARDQDKISVAKDFLDRAGFKPVDKLEHSGSVDLAKTAKELEEFFSS